MIKPIFVLCVFIVAIHAYPFRQKLFGACTSPRVPCLPCQIMTSSCACICPWTERCKAGQSPEFDACDCASCRGAEEVKTALEEEAQEEMVEEAENRSRWRPRLKASSATGNWQLATGNWRQRISGYLIDIFISSLQILFYRFSTLKMIQVRYTDFSYKNVYFFWGSMFLFEMHFEPLNVLMFSFFLSFQSNI